MWEGTWEKIKHGGVWKYEISREGGGNRERKLSKERGYNVQNVVKKGDGEGK